jgi:hypothetical protein
MLIRLSVKIDPFKQDAPAIRKALIDAGVPEGDIETAPCRAPAKPAKKGSAKRQPAETEASA